MRLTDKEFEYLWDILHNYEVPDNVQENKEEYDKEVKLLKGLGLKFKIEYVRRVRVKQRSHNK